MALVQNRKREFTNSRREPMHSRFLIAITYPAQRHTQYGSEDNVKTMVTCQKADCCFYRRTQLPSISSGNFASTRREVHKGTSQASCHPSLLDRKNVPRGRHRTENMATH